jgi:hypothetical protein
MYASLADDFYVLSKRSKEPAPKIIPKEAFTPELDLLKDILVAEYTDAPVVELEDPKSGLGIKFDTNRMSFSLFLLCLFACYFA